MPRDFVIFQLGSDPFKGEKKIVQIMGFMVFKSTGLDSRFQRKNRFWKICTGSRDIGQNMSNFAGLVWKADFGHFFGNILGLRTYFSKPIFALKPWVRAGWFEYHEPHNRNNFFFTYKGVCAIFRAISDTVPSLGFEFRFLRLFTQTQSHTFGT